MRLFKTILALAGLLSLTAQPVLAQQTFGAAVRTANPTYVNGETRPLSLDTSGNLRVTTGSGAASQQVQGTSASGATASGNPVQTGGVFTTTPAAVTTGQARAQQMTSTGAAHVVSVGTADATGGIAATVTSVAAGSLIAKASAGNIYDWQVTSGASAGYVMIFNSTTVPADGTVTPTQCVAVAANTTVGSAFHQVAERYGTGIVLVFSTTGCFTKTISATAFIRARVQ